MTLRDKDLSEALQNSGKKPESGLNAPDSSDSNSGETAHAQHDPVAAARKEIADHEESDRSRSLLGRATSFFYSKDEDSLARLKQLTSDYDHAVKQGDKEAAAKIQKDLSGKLEEDKRYLAMKDDIAHYGSSFVKTAALFSRGEVGLVTTAASYALDQINSKNRDHWAVDGTLGLGKGLATRGVFELLGHTELGAVNKGMLLGIGNRFSDLALTRQTWEGGLGSGTSKVLGGMGSLENLATDGIVFGLAHGLGFAGEKAAGDMSKSPVLSSMFTASTFGLLSGGAGEVNRQRDAEHRSFGSFDYGKIARAGFTEAAIDGLAGAPGGFQSAAASRAPSEYRTPPELRPNSLSERLNGSKISPTSLAFTDIVLHMPEDRAADSTAASLDFTTSAKEKVSGSGIAKLWWPERDIYNLSSEQRYELLQHIRTPLFQEAPINDFSRRIIDATRDWTDITHLKNQSKTQRDALFEATRHVQQMVDDGVIPIHLAARTHEHALIEEELADKPDELSKYRQYTDARNKYSQTTEALRTELDRRASDLTQTINEFARAHGLPSIRVSHAQDLGAAAANYNTGTGIMTIRDERLLSPDRTAELVGSTYHELVHSEQDVIIMRSVADELGIGKMATAEQIAEMQKRLLETAKINADMKRVVQVLKLRDGVPLTEEEKERADLLAQGFRINKRVDYKDTGDDFRMIARELKIIDEKNAGYILTDKLMNSKSGLLSKHLFGDTTPPKEVKAIMNRLEQFHDDSDVPWDDALVRRFYKNLLTRRLNEINEYRQQQYADYMAGEHEKEAWGVGERARFLAKHMLDTISGAADVAANSRIVPMPRANDNAPVPANDNQQQRNLGIAANLRGAAMNLEFSDPDEGSS